MNSVSVALLLLAFPGGVLLGWGQQRNQSGVRIGTGHRQITATGPTNVRGGSGIKIGGANKAARNYSKPTTPAPLPTLPPAPPPPPPQSPPVYSSKGLPILNITVSKYGPLLVEMRLEQFRKQKMDITESISVLMVSDLEQNSSDGTHF